MGDYKPTDPEIKAMNEIARSMKQIEDDREAVKRVADWVQDRFDAGVLAGMGRAFMEEMKLHQDMIERRAKDLGVTERQWMHSVSAMRELQGLAPIEVRQEIEEAEQKIAKP